MEEMGPITEEDKIKNYEKIITLIESMEKGSKDDVKSFSLTMDKFECRVVLTALKIFKSVLDSRKNIGPFICGTVGKEDAMGLHDGYFICPHYGLSGFAVYKKDGEYSEPGY